mmetsp:Transcript_36432/g.58417  ORF Transcript_36432/g.58417 Transcript_36432/m.58417 type:complete len:114 (+) Transcript_36432:110-451(+)
MSTTDDNNNKDKNNIDTAQHEEKLVNEINTLKTKLGTYQQLSEDPKDIACSACPSQKLAYEICMQKWYNDVFLKGNAGTQLPCQPEYEVYNKCVLEHLREKKLEHLLQFEFKE